MKTATEILECLKNSKAVIEDSFIEDDGFIGIRGYIRFNRELFVFVASNGEGWEHVSISSQPCCPDWNRMCYFKDIFWKPNEAVMQLHPPQSSYVNIHKYCLHLWRPIDGEIPLPPKMLV